MKIIQNMAIVALLLKNSEQMAIKENSKFLDDGLYGDDTLPMQFQFKEDPGDSEPEKAKYNDFLSEGTPVKGSFSEALDMVNDDFKLE